QTHFPNHPLLRRLIDNGYSGFAEAALQEREASGWPPYKPIALLRTSSTNKTHCFDFLLQAKRSAQELIPKGVTLLGPASAPMERRAGRYRAQLLILSNERAPLHRFLKLWIPALAQHRSVRRVRWSVDVDPIELF
ncbi:MAG: primosomal protein N', partial [Pseudomonadota bacterium]